MDLLKLLANSSSLLTAHMPADKARAIKNMLGEERTDVGHILQHVESIMADGKLTTSDIPDVVMFCIELFTFVSMMTPISFTRDEVFTLSENAVIVIISAPRFALNEIEVKVATGIADTCFVLAKKVVTGAGACSSFCIWMSSCFRRPHYTPVNKEPAAKLVVDSTTQLKAVVV